MTLQLLSKEQCPFCWQVKIAFNHLDIEYQLKEWKVPDKEFLLQHSPQGTSPILLVDNFPIWDSQAIVYYLEDIATNGKTLFPGNETERAKSRLLQAYSNSIAGKGLREVIFEKRSKHQSEWNMERIEKGDKDWRKSLDWLETQIESHDSFLAVGFSVADATLLPRFILAEHYDVGVNDLHPKLLNWFQYWRKMSITRPF